MYLEKYDLSGRAAVITGGGRGSDCCQALAEAGATVVIAEIDPEVAAAGAAELRDAGHEPVVVPLDVADPDQVTRVAYDLASQFGTVDILVCNAGIARSGVRAEEVADEHWRM